MHVILKIVADLFFKYGKANAGIPSIHGVFEAPVPQQLQEQERS